MSSWLSTVSPQPDDEVPPTPRLTERKPEKEKEEGKRKRSKSMSKAKEEKEGNNKGEKRGKKKGEEGEQATNEQVEEEKKGVTIAKLGPFKMSMELKGAGGKAEKGDGERQNKAVRSRSRSRPREEKTRRQTSKLEEKKEEKTANKEEVKEIEKESKRVESRRKKEKIVVSKMARSDRPLREKSPEKGRRREEDEEERRQKDKIEEEEEDYRLSLNRKREKFTRSVSQPGPPPSLDFLLPAVTNRSSGKGGPKSKLGSSGSQKLTSGPRNDSFSETQPGPGLMRSNTLQEEVPYP